MDVHFLDHDGGLVDAACVAVMASLLSFRREDVEVRGEEVKVVLSLKALVLHNAGLARSHSHVLDFCTLLEFVWGVQS